MPEAGAFYMPALRMRKVQLSRWWTVPPVVIVLAFNILLEKMWPTISARVQFLILLAASAISFGFVFGVAWLIACFRAPWNDS
jgi:hypothetical protein